MQTESQKDLQANLQVLRKTPLWTVNYILICMSSLTMFLALYSLIPTLPIYIERFGGTTSAAGLALAALTVGAVISRPLAGWALDKYGRRMIFLGGLVFFLLPTVIYIWMVPVITLIALRFFQGLGWGVGNTGSNTVASDIVPRERLGEGMGFFSVTLSISMAAAPALGLWLIGHYSFKALFMACSLLTLASIVLAAFIKYPQIKKQTTVPKLVFMEKSALRPAMVMLCMTINYSSLLSFLSLHAMEQGLVNAGLFFTSLAVTTLVSRPLSGIIVDRFGAKGYDLGILIGIFATIAAVPVLAQTTSLLHLAVGGILYGIGFGFVQPMMLTLAIRSVSPEKKGAANATFWTGFDIGVAIGSITWGMVAAAMGYRFMFYLSIIPLAVAMVIFFSRRQAKSTIVEF